MTSTTSPTARNKRFTIYFVSNICFVLFMLAAIPLIRTGQARFVPHAEVNREYVAQTLASGTPEEIDHALKSTEVYRAAGYRNLIVMMGLMQISAVALAVLFIVNGVVLFRLRQPVPDPVRA